MKHVLALAIGLCFCVGALCGFALSAYALEESESPEIVEQPTVEPSLDPTVEPSPDPSLEPTAEPTIEPSLEPTAEPSLEPTVEPSLEPTAEPILFALNLSKACAYGVAQEKEIGVAVDFLGGIAPYTLSLEVYRNGEIVFTESYETPDSRLNLSYLPLSGGNFSLKCSALDSAQQSAFAEIVFPVAIHAPESRSTWEDTLAHVELTGDWRADIVAIAESQLGYCESRADFIVDDANTFHYYSRYSDWYGAPYAKWNAMFVTFCARYAGVPAIAFPKKPNCNALRYSCVVRGVYHAASYYAPAAGDIVFFNLDSEEDVDQVGIVCGFDENLMLVIEGDAQDGVVRRSYDPNADCVLGYANMDEMIAYAQQNQSSEDDPDASADTDEQIHIDCDMPTLTFTAHKQYRWNTDTLCWETVTSSNISGSTVTFSLYNDRDASVKVRLQFTPDPAIGDAVSVAFDQNEIILPPSSENANAVVITATITLNDAAKLADAGALGTYSVVIDDSNQQNYDLQ